MFYFCLSDSLCLPFLVVPSQFEHYLIHRYMKDQIPMIESEIDMQMIWEMIVWVLPFSVARIFPQSLIFEFFNWKVRKVIGKSLHLENMYKSTFLCWKTSMKEPKLRTFTSLKSAKPSSIEELAQTSLKIFQFSRS